MDILYDLSLVRRGWTRENGTGSSLERKETLEKFRLFPPPTRNFLYSNEIPKEMRTIVTETS